jgi:hypothetical protein
VCGAGTHAGCCVVAGGVGGLVLAGARPGAGGVGRPGVGAGGQAGGGGGGGVLGRENVLVRLWEGEVHVRHGERRHRVVVTAVGGRQLLRDPLLREATQAGGSAGEARGTIRGKQGPPRRV